MLLSGSPSLIVTSSADIPVLKGMAKYSHSFARHFFGFDKSCRDLNFTSSSLFVSILFLLSYESHAIMEDASQDVLLPSTRIVQDPLSVTRLECNDRRSHDASDARQTSETQHKLHTEISELQTLVRDLQGRFAGFPAIRSRYRLSSHDFTRLDGYLEKVGWDNLRYRTSRSFDVDRRLT